MPAASSPRYLIGTVEFDVLWEDVLRADALGSAGSGSGSDRRSPPAVLRIGSAGRTHSARRELVAASRQALCRRGLADRAGPHPGPARLLRLLARPDRQLELRADGDPPVRAVAAARDGDGALAVRRGDVVELARCDSLSVALLGALPPSGPGPGRAGSMPTVALAAALATSWSASVVVSGTAGAQAVPPNTHQPDLPQAPRPVPPDASPIALRTAPPEECVLVAALIDNRVPEPDARQLGRMLAAVERQAQIVALRRDRNGELRRVGGVLRVLDGPQGRYLLIRAPGWDGVDRTSVAPTDARRLRLRVSELLHAATPDELLPCGPETTTGW